jgi:hypothetical protein
MMAQHKWHKEIKAWADGAEIEGQTNHPDYSKKWITYKDPSWNSEIKMKFRIKQQPKEPQYLYVYFTGLEEVSLSTLDNLNQYELLGKIKLEVDDGQ